MTAAQSTSVALEPFNQAIQARINDSSVVSADETGWRISGRSVWLWVATTDQVTAYNIAWGRGFDQACELLDATFAGTLVCDGWAPYRSFLLLGLTLMGDNSDFLFGCAAPVPPAAAPAGDLRRLAAEGGGGHDDRLALRPPPAAGSGDAPGGAGGAQPGALVPGGVEPAGLAPRQTG